MGFTKFSDIIQIKSTKLKQKKVVVAGNVDDNNDDDDDEDNLLEGEIPIKEYNYLVQMPMISMTYEKIEKLKSEIEKTKNEIEIL